LVFYKNFNGLAIAKNFLFKKYLFIQYPVILTFNHVNYNDFKNSYKKELCTMLDCIQIL